MGFVTGVVTLTKEVPCAVAPQKMFNAFCTDFHDIVPKAVPNAVRSIDVNSGSPGGSGCVQKINMADTSTGKHVKIKLDSVDENNLSFKYTVTEFDEPAGAAENIDFIVSEVKFEAAEGGGCIIKAKNNYHIKENSSRKKEDLEAGQEKYMGMYKLVESYLVQAN